MPKYLRNFMTSEKLITEKDLDKPVSQFDVNKKLWLQEANNANRPILKLYVSFANNR
jgi:hypothetical protein